MTETLSEIVEREAAEAEADETAAEQEPGAADGPDSPAPAEHAERVEQAERQVDLAEREKRLKQEDGRHENALKRIYGDEFVDHLFCPLCLGQGFLTAIPSGQQPDDVWEAVTALSGRTPSAEFEHPGELEACERCAGYGQVATGARNEHNALIACARCDGRGYHNLEDPVHRGRLGLQPAQQAAPVAPSYAAYQPPGSVPNGVPLEPPAGWYGNGKPGADPFDRWPGHPRYGIDPATGGW